MTDTTHSVTRRSIGTVFDRGNRRVIVTIGEGDVIKFRLERQRQEYVAAIPSLFNTAAMWHCNSQHRAFEKRVKELTKAGNNRRTAKKLARQEGKA